MVENHMQTFRVHGKDRIIRYGKIDETSCPGYAGHFGMQPGDLIAVRLDEPAFRDVWWMERLPFYFENGLVWTPIGQSDLFWIDRYDLPFFQDQALHLI